MDLKVLHFSNTQCRNNNDQLTPLPFPSFLEFLPTVPPLRQYTKEEKSVILNTLQKSKNIKAS